MTDCTHCPSCGAPVALETAHCPYCGVPYPRPRKQAQAVAIDLGIASPSKVMATSLAQQLQAAIITQNEARARMGLPPV